MIDLKQYPNEVILACLHPIAYENGFYLYPQYIGTRSDWHNCSFYNMLTKISNPDLLNEYIEKIENLKKNHAKDKKDFEAQYYMGLITLDDLMTDIGNLNVKLNSSIEKCENEYTSYVNIQKKLTMALQKFDIEGYNQAKPIIMHSYELHKFVVTKGYIIDLGPEAERSECEYYYIPEVKAKFDKLLGKTKTTQKTEPEKTK